MDSLTSKQYEILLQLYHEANDIFLELSPNSRALFYDYLYMHKEFPES